MSSPVPIETLGAIAAGFSPTWNPVKGENFQEEAVQMVIASKPPPAPQSNITVPKDLVISIIAHTPPDKLAKELSLLLAALEAEEHEKKLKELFEEAAMIDKANKTKLQEAAEADVKKSKSGAELVTAIMSTIQIFVKNILAEIHLKGVEAYLKEKNHGTIPDLYKALAKELNDGTTADQLRGMSHSDLAVKVVAVERKVEAVLKIQLSTNQLTPEQLKTLTEEAVNTLAYCAMLKDPTLRDDYQRALESAERKVNDLIKLRAPNRNNFVRSTISQIHKFGADINGFMALLEDRYTDAVTSLTSSLRGPTPVRTAIAKDISKDAAAAYKETLKMSISRYIHSHAEGDESDLRARYDAAKAAIEAHAPTEMHADLFKQLDTAYSNASRALVEAETLTAKSSIADPLDRARVPRPTAMTKGGG